MIRLEESLARRIRHYYAFQILVSFQLWSPFWVLWLTSNVATYFEATLVDVAFWITSLFVAIPAGILADRHGRKPAILLGVIMWTLGVVLFGLSTTFSLFVVANAIWAIGAGFMWGIQSAYLYDTLLEAGRAEVYPRIVSYATLMGFLSTSVASILGGLVVASTGRFDLTLLATGFVGVGAVAAVLRFVEPQVPREAEFYFIKQLRDGLRTAGTSPQIRAIILFQVLIGVETYVMAFFRQNFLQELVEANYIWMGLLYGGFLAIAGVAGLSTHRVLKRLGEFGSLLFTFLLVYPSFLLVFFVGVPGLLPWSLRLGLGSLAQATFYVIWGLEWPIVTTLLNRRVISRERATVFGISGFFQTLALALFEPLVGMAATILDLSLGLAVMALAGLPPTLYAILAFRKSLAKEGPVPVPAGGAEGPVFK